MNPPQAETGRRAIPEPGALVSFTLIQGQGHIWGRMCISAGRGRAAPTSASLGRLGALEGAPVLLLTLPPSLHMRGPRRKLAGMGRAGQYLKTWTPQPAIKVKKRGGRSRDGLIAYPEFMPRDTPMMTTRRPITTACVPCCAGLFLLSVMANRHSWSSPVSNTWGVDAMVATQGPSPNPGAETCLGMVPIQNSCPLDGEGLLLSPS